MERPLAGSGVPDGETHDLVGEINQQVAENLSDAEREASVWPELENPIGHTAGQAPVS